MGGKAAKSSKPEIRARATFLILYDQLRADRSRSTLAPSP